MYPSPLAVFVSYVEIDVYFSLFSNFIALKIMCSSWSVLDLKLKFESKSIKERNLVSADRREIGNV